MSRLLKYQIGIVVLLASLFGFAEFDSIDQVSSNQNISALSSFDDAGHNGMHHVDQPHHQITFDETLDEKEDNEDHDSHKLNSGESTNKSKVDHRALLLSYSIKRYYPSLSKNFYSFEHLFLRLNNFRL